MNIVFSTEHFSDRELACKCGQCANGMEATFMRTLERIRGRFGGPMVLTSAYRCPEYNAKVSNTGADGPHTHRRAVDVRVSGRDAYRMIMIAQNEGMTGIGVMQRGEHGRRFIHLDDLDGSVRPWIWSY